MVNTSQELAAAAAKLLTRYHQPVLVETYLPGREFTVGIVGNGEDAAVLGVCEILLKEDAEANIYSLHNKELCEELVIYQRADDDEARLAGAARACRLSCASSAATPPASTSAPTRQASRISSRPTRSPGCIRITPIFPFSPRRTAIPTSS